MNIFAVGERGYHRWTGEAKHFPNSLLHAYILRKGILTLRICLGKELHAMETFSSALCLEVRVTYRLLPQLSG